MLSAKSAAQVGLGSSAGALGLDPLFPRLLGVQ